MATRRRVLSRLAFSGAVVFAFVLAAPAGPRAAGHGDCLVAQIPETLRLPDGSVHQAATLTVCDTVSMSPAVTLHKTMIDGRPVGLFASRRRAAEAEPGRPPVMVFARDVDGTLALIGCVVTEGGRSVSYVLAERPRSSMARLPGAGSMPVVELAASRSAH